MWLSWEQDTGCWQSLSSLSRPGPTFKAASWPSLVGGPRPAPLASSTSPGLVFMELIRWRKTFKVSHVHVISLIENYKYKRKFTLNRYLNINILFYLYFYKRNWELWIDENWSISNKRQSKKLLLKCSTPYVIFLMKTISGKVKGVQSPNLQTHFRYLWNALLKNHLQGHLSAFLDALLGHTYQKDENTRGVF